MEFDERLAVLEERVAALEAQRGRPGVPEDTF
jgi:uncharacterized small protein (DUF1192 family)